MYQYQQQEETRGDILIVGAHENNLKNRHGNVQRVC